jgi:hypothetical protein
VLRRVGPGSLGGAGAGYGQLRVIWLMASDRPSRGLLGFYTTTPAVAGFALSVGALAYALVAGVLHVYANQWIDFPLLAVPWVGLVGFGLAASLRAIGDLGRTAGDRWLVYAGLCLVAVQLAAGIVLVIGSFCLICL